MKFSNTLPYPVLADGNNNYVHSTFDVTVTASPSFGELKINSTFDLQNEGLQELINQKQAEFAIHIECSVTSYRQLYRSFNSELEITIEGNFLRGKIDLHPFIIANQKIIDYTNDNWSDFYKGYTAMFEKGSVLAIGKAIELILHEEPLSEQNLPSIVHVHKSTKAKYMQVDLNSNQITIILPEAQYNQYVHNGRSRLQNSLLTMVIFPALIDVLHLVKANSTTYEDYRWYQVVQQVFKSNNLPLEKVLSESISVIEAVQILLHNPLVGALNEVERILHRKGEKFED